MGSINIIEEYFCPFHGTKQWIDGSFENKMCAIAGLALIATAGIRYEFFKMAPQTAGILAASGSAFLASHWTEKKGYAYLVAIAAVSYLGVATLEGIQSGRMIVHLDLVETIKVAKDLFKPKPKGQAW